METIPEDTLSRSQINELTDNGTVIGHKGKFPAVILSPDQTVYKFWVKRPRLGRLIKSRSYARRFIKASQHLNREGFVAPKIISYLTIENHLGEVVRYHQLPGTSIRDLLETSPNTIDIPQLMKIYFDLHEAGFMIRTLHFGNILQEEDGRMILIDCSNVRKFRRALSPITRAKNLATPLRYSQDLRRYQDAGLPDFVESYLKLGTFTDAEKDQIRATVAQRMKTSK